jgi:hypothetical protein
MKKMNGLLSNMEVQLVQKGRGEKCSGDHVVRERDDEKC